MKADPAAQQRLLDLQVLDSRADQLRHQRAHLPEHAQIAELQTTREELVDQRRDRQIVVEDLSVAQRKADADVEQVKARRTRDRDRMDQGLITNPKDLERMQHELATLERRITALEDEELEVMEALEEAQSVLGAIGERIEEADEQLAELTAARDEKLTALSAELDRLIADRSPAAEGMPEDLLALYERLRTSKDGVGAAELRARECGGCRLGIDNAELQQIRNSPEDLVIRCEECQRILVRTPESGL